MGLGLLILQWKQQDCMVTMQKKGLVLKLNCELLEKQQDFFFFIGIHPMQGWTATTRYGVTRKKAQKRLQGTENLFRKNLQLKDVC